MEIAKSCAPISTTDTKSTGRKETAMSIKHLVPWINGDPFLSLRDEMEGVFDSFLGGPLAPLSLWNGEEFAPRVNVVEEEQTISVSAELPGLEEKDVELTLTDGALTIQGEKKSESVEKGHGFYRSERLYGSFHRTVALPTEVDADKAEATFKHGVLTVTLPKTAQAKAKKIPVKAK